MRQELSTAVLDGKIFVIAGFDSSGTSTNTVEVYDPETDTWTSAAPLPIATNHNAAAVAAGKLYAFGGTSKRAFVYHPDQNSWSDVAPTNYMHSDTPAVAVIDDLIYVAGGSGGVGNEAEVYVPATDSWRQLAPMQTPRHGIFAAVTGNVIYIPGGGIQQGFGATDVNEAYVVADECL